MTLKIFLFLVFYDAIETAIHFFLKKAAVTQAAFAVRTPIDVPIFIGHMLLTPYLWLGLLCAVVVVSTWTFILSKIDLSLAIPFAGLTYVFVALVSLVFFHEHISILRWTGMLLIVLGVAAVSTEPTPTQAGRS